MWWFERSGGSQPGYSVEANLAPCLTPRLEPALPLESKNACRDTGVGRVERWRGEDGWMHWRRFRIGHVLVPDGVKRRI